ncbi:MAG TPA: hypothetical protein DD637_00890 [Verrucomicrobia bacterium]|nr:hypothetical protein [Verrucomicrobiota bacterium]
MTVDAVTGLVYMFKDAGFLYWVITLYSILVGAAMTYVGRRHFKKLLFFVGAFTVYVPMHYFASEMVSLIAAAVGGLVMVFCYPVFVFLIGMTPLCAIYAACGVEHPGFILALLAAACGVAAVIFRKHIVIPVSALSGGMMLALGLAFLFKGLHPVLFLLLIVLFTASGIFVQYKFTAKGLKDEKKPEPTKPEPTK